MKIGARIIKTGVAVAITMLICGIFALEPAFFGAVSAVINMQPSIFHTIRTAKDQLLVHILGVSAGFLFGFFIGVNPISAGLITILLIFLYTKLKLQSGVTMGIVAALFVLSSNAAEFYSHALARTLVIFIGLGSAMLVNIFLWPPRYNQRFTELLRESNIEAVRYFCQAVHDFVHLQDEAPDLNKEHRTKVCNLNKEARRLSELLNREQELVSDGPIEQDNWFILAEKLIGYNEALVRKGDRIYNLLPGRFDRRTQSGAPPISDEFRTILEILESGCISITRLNEKLRAVIIERGWAEPEEISEEYWEELTKAIEQWQPKLTGSYYLHGLIEATVTANEIKWAARDAKVLLYGSTESQDKTIHPRA